MVQWHGLSRRKVTGGYLKLRRAKRRSELGSDAVPCIMGEDVRKQLRTRGGHHKTRALHLSVANVTDSASGKTSKATIKTVIENPANPHYVRRNVITKGAIVDTNLGRARVTSRPGQDGAINATLVG